MIGSSRGVLDRNHYRDDDQEEDDDEQRHQLDVLPPHLAFEAATADPELARAAAQTVCLINKQINALSPLQQALNIACHNSTHIVHLALDIGNRIIAATARGAELDHQVLELGVEAAGAVIGHVCEVGGGDVELVEEALPDLEEEAEGHAPAERRLRDHEEG